MSRDPESLDEVGVEFEVFDCEACGSESGQSDGSYRRPGNSLEGNVHIFAKSPLHFARLEVRFQGNLEVTLFGKLAANSRE